MSTANPFKKWNPGSASCDWCADPFECPTGTPCADTFLSCGLCSGDFNYTPAAASNWSASDSVTTGARRKATAAVGGFSVGEVILSLSNRTTGSTFDSTEAANWEAEGCVDVRPEYYTVTFPAYEGFSDPDDAVCGDIPPGPIELAWTGVGYLYTESDGDNTVIINLLCSSPNSLDIETFTTENGFQNTTYYFDSVDFDCAESTIILTPEMIQEAGSYCFALGNVALTKGPLVPI